MIIDRLSASYANVLAEVIKGGNLVPSRVGDTKEYTGYRLVIMEPEWCVVERPGFSRGFMEVEIAQLLAGHYDRAGLARFAPRAAELITTKTAYGPRTARQVEVAAQELKETPLSRRAVIAIIRHNDLDILKTGPQRERDLRAGEMPCTMTMQLLLRDDRLQSIVTMRSWDLVWGLAYDVPSFVSVQMAVARVIGAKLGPITVNAGSGHVYEKHWEVEPTDPGEAGKLEIPWLRDTIGETREQAWLRIRGWDAVGR